MIRPICLALICLLTNPHAQAVDLSKSENMFFIKRSKNTNEVHNDALVDGWTWRHPEVDYYWHELEVGPSVYAPIRCWEVMAIGLDVDRLSKTKIRLRLKALPDRPITARLERTDTNACKVVVRTAINGGSDSLRSVYVHAVEGLFGLPMWLLRILGLPTADDEKATDSLVGYLREYLPQDAWDVDDATPAAEIDAVAPRFAKNAF